LINLKPNGLLPGIAGAFLCLAVTAGAQTQSAPPAPAPAPASAQASAPAPPPPVAAPTWSVGGIDFSGFLDGYYSYNANRPSNAANGQANDLYNFDDKADQFSLSAAKLTLNHDPDPVGVHADLIFGRANDLIHPSTDKDTDDYLEQAYISFKPPKAHGTELDFGQFVTSAGAEVIEAKDNWNYSRSLLFSWAIPYYHFGLRSSVPVTKTWTAGLQVVNGWNDVVANNGGVTIGLTSAYTKPKYTWDLNYYTGPQNTDTQKGYRNLIDTTLLLTPNSKFNAYINYDYGQNKIPSSTVDDDGSSIVVPSQSPHWQGIAVAAHEQVNAHSSFSGRYEHFADNQGYETGTAQNLQEFTGTYEYKWLEGLLTRVEYRRDWSNIDFFHKGDTEMVDAQSTLTVAFIAFFGPKR
jgi:hypothetical protein